ncbi:MAG: hypothetical protein JXA79_12150, partial [Deltaproteobacteria bacterium]|nr:hypothetical protein [Deltaproteobacteria bacterium]
ALHGLGKDYTMKMSFLMVAMIDLQLPIWVTASCLFLMLLAILFILFIVFYTKMTKHKQIMSAMEKGIPVADFIAKPLSAREIAIRNLSAGVGFLVIGLLLVGLWYYAIEAPNIDIISNWIPMIGGVMAGVGVLFLYRGILQMHHCGPAIPWFTKLAAGIGLLFIALALIAVWCLPYIINDMNIWDQKILIVAGILSGLALMLMVMGILQKISDRKKPERNGLKNDS